MSDVSASLSARVARLLGVLALAGALVGVGGVAIDAAARCSVCDDSRIEEPEELAVSFPRASGGRALIERIVVLSDHGAYAAFTPARAAATNEDRIDVRGALGEAGGLGRLFPRPLTAYVRSGRRVGTVFLNGETLIVDARGAGPGATKQTLATGAVALLTRTPFRRRLAGLRLTLDFQRVRAGRGDLGVPAGHAYLSPNGLVLAPPPSTLPGY